MTSRSKSLNALLSAAGRRCRPTLPGRLIGQARYLHGTPSRRTDGVFRGLTDDRLPTPWIEAFQRQQEGKGAGPSSDKPCERDMTPRKMSDSYHRVVLPLGRDPWLSDTYINSSGHIRYGAQLDIPGAAHDAQLC